MLCTHCRHRSIFEWFFLFLALSSAKLKKTKTSVKFITKESQHQPQIDEILYFVKQNKKYKANLRIQWKRYAYLVYDVQFMNKPVVPYYNWKHHIYPSSLASAPAPVYLWVFLYKILFFFFRSRIEQLKPGEIFIFIIIAVRAYSFIQSNSRIE